MSIIYDALKEAQKQRVSNDAPGVVRDVDENAPTKTNVVNDTQAYETNVTAHINNIADQPSQDISTRLVELLKSKNKITESDLSKIQRMQVEKPDVTFIEFIARLGLVGDLDIAESISEILEIPLVRREQFPATNVAEDLVSERYLKEQKVIPLSIDDNSVQLVMSNPTDAEAIEAMKMACERDVMINVGIASEIDAWIEDTLNERSSELDQILDDVVIEEISDEEIDHLKDLASEAPVIRMVNLYIQRAAEQRASDIHIEPFEGQLKVRYRIDGVLKEIESPPKQFSAAIISRIKIMAKLDIAERRLPQDGRIRSRLQGKEFDMRISTIPTMHGESVVIRLLNQENVVLDFESLGFSEKIRTELIETLRMPHGVILITGPTGSGKTTTLYTALRLLNEPNRKIITVEDPIEYQLEGINQIQAKSSIGLTFASALRSIVRQDPDVIMVGEMRDTETAEICIKSALTGHLVLSTLHTNDAPSSITRLLEMRVEDYLLTSTLNAVLAQRLVRVLCSNCKKPHAMSDKLIAECVANDIDTSPYENMYIAKGCSECGNTGYSGRTCIVEFLKLDEPIKKKILERSDSDDLQKIAVESGMLTMYQDGLNKVLQGITTIEEVTRVTKE